VTDGKILITGVGTVHVNEAIQGASGPTAGLSGGSSIYTSLGSIS